MANVTSDYVLSIDDLPSLYVLINMQNRLGSGMGSTSPDNLPEFFRYLILLGLSYPDVKQAKVKTIFDAVFNVVKAVPNHIEMGLVSQYYDYCRTQGISAPPKDEPTLSGCSGATYSWTSYWHTFRNGFCYTWRYDFSADQWTTNQWWPGTVLPNHPERRAAIEAMLTTWGGTPPETYIDQGLKLEDNTPVTTSKTKLDTWSGANAMPSKAITPMEAQVNTIVKAILADTNFVPEGYFLLLHLLISMATSSTTDQQMAENILKFKVTSIEYPNDTFINHLVYMVLMILVDPVGQYHFDRIQLKSTLNDLLSVITGTNESSKSIKGSINRSLAVINADPSYPMHDPYSPQIGFTTRMTDTMEALDAARKKLSN